MWAHGPSRLCGVCPTSADASRVYVDPEEPDYDFFIEVLKKVGRSFGAKVGLKEFRGEGSSCLSIRDWQGWPYQQRA